MFLLTTVAVVTVAVSVLYLYFTRTFNYWKDRNIPGPKPVPLFGNLFRSALRYVPIGEILKKVYDSYPDEKVVGIFRMTTPCLLIRDLDIVKQVMIKDFDNFLDRGVEFSKAGLGQNLFHSDGETWRALRSRFSPIFTNQKLKNMMHLLDDRANKFIDYINEITAKSTEHDAHALVQKYTMSTISACAFGIDMDTFHGDIETLKKVDKAIFTPNFAFELDMMYQGLLKNLNMSMFPQYINRFFKELVDTVITQRNGVPSKRNDFMDLILEMKNQKEIQSAKRFGDEDAKMMEITNSIIEAQAFIFYAAGYETSASTMGFTLYQLALEPEIQDRLINEIDEYLQRHDGRIELDTLNELKYLDQVLSETLRMYPIVDSLQRKAKNDYECPGTNLKVAKEQMVIVSALGIHRDEKYYPNPEKFNPDNFTPENVAGRHPCAYLPFGVGPRHCVDSKRDHCNKTVEIYEDVSSPPVTPENFGRPLTCTYRFRAFRGSPKDWILRIRFKKFKVGTLINGTTCHKGYMQIVDGNAKTDVSNRKEPGLFCGEIEQPQTFISETNFVKIVFHADNFTDQTYFSFDSRAEQQFEVYLRYGQHPELYPNRRGEVVAGSYCERVFRDCRLQTCYVQSAAYPGVYPRNLHCRYHLNTRLPYIKLYIENEEFNIDGQRCENIMTCPMRPITSGAENCPYDFIKIYDGKDESAFVIGTFCGMGKFPYSIIGTSQDLFVEFVSSPAGPLLNTGFHFNVGNWPGHVEAPGSKVGKCDWLLTAESLKKSGDTEGIFLSVAHWYPPHTSCTYLMQGFPGQVVRLYFPSFRINRIESPIVPWTGDCGESLTLYDAPRPDDAKIIKTFCDTFSRPMEKHDFVSTGNAMFVRFESKTGSYSGSSLYYWAHYDFFNNTRFGEPVQGTACDEVIASWKQRAGRLRSPLNTLVYKQAPPGEDVHCLYRFVTDKRIYARVILTILSINFKEHPYTPVSCQNCYEDRADKLIVWEPTAGGRSYNASLGVSTTPLPLHLAVQRALGSCLCAKHSNTVTRARPYRVVSSGESLNLQLIVDNAHAAASYFKNPSPLFEARYEFVHGPLCGPAVLAAASDGEIVYPHLEALGYTEPPKRIQCIWDLEIEEKRDIWLHFDSIKFASRHCEDGNIQIYLPGRVEPYLSVCGENVSLARELPILSAGELGFESLDDPLVIEKEKTRSIRIVFIGSASPARANFKIAWTGLYHLPKNSDGTLMTSRLTDGSGVKSSDSMHGCDFICPGEALCIPARLICNGVVNCPNVTSTERKFWTAEEKSAREAYSEDSLRRLGYLDLLGGMPLGQLHDEAPELCAGARSAGGGDWQAPALGAGLAIALGVLALGAAWRLCCRKRSPDEESLDY